MRIKIISKDSRVWIIYIILMLSMLFGGLESLGVPHKAVFLIDAFNIFLAFNVIRNIKGKHILNPIVMTQTLFLLIGVFVAFLNDVSVFQIVWALRNYDRFVLFYAACLLYLDEKAEKAFWKMMLWIYYINFLVMNYQFYFAGISRDDLGGLFGGTGSNSALNIFILIVLCYVTSSWLSKKKSIVSLSAVYGIAIYEAVLAEIKIVFIEIAILFVLCLVFNLWYVHDIRKILKIVFVGAGAAIAMSFAATFLYRLYPIFNKFFTVRYILDEATRPGGYTNSGDLNRLTAFISINHIVFHDNILNMVFGKGLGHGEFSEGLKILTGSFYTRYSYLHYHWFSHAWLYIENGIIGLTLYCSGFLLTLIGGIKKMRQNSILTYHYLPSILLIVFFPVIMVYNQSLRLESAYMYYLVLSFLSIKRKCLDGK